MRLPRSSPQNKIILAKLTKPREDLGAVLERLRAERKNSPQILSVNSTILAISPELPTFRKSMHLPRSFPQNKTILAKLTKPREDLGAVLE